ncbi:MAG: tRNA (cytidine(34)-2'-O)-methyltransferase [Planctomycetota bacterium]
MTAPSLHVVLVEPEIPNNTGNIGRTCIAAGAALHLVHPLGFHTDDKALKRAGMDYWPRVECTEHESWSAYERVHCAPTGGQPAHYFFTTKADRCLWEVSFARGDRLVFGKESVGLDESIRAAHPDHLITVPMAPGERSLNLSSCVAIVVYEALRQMHMRGDIPLEGDARLVGVPGTHE